MLFEKQFVWEKFSSLNKCQCTHKKHSGHFRIRNQQQTFIYMYETNILSVGQRRLLHKCAFRYALLFLIHIWILERRVPRFKKPVYKRIHNQTLESIPNSNRIELKPNETKLNRTELSSTEPNDQQSRMCL